MTTPTFFVVPHPDDEMSAWSLVQTARRPVFLLMTQGERSVFCADEGGVGSEQCKRRRVASWRGFLRDALAADGRGTGRRPDHRIHDHGDGDLTADEVVAAIRDAVTTWGEPDVVVAAGYVGPDYEHPDHIAVHDGVRRSGLPAMGATSPDRGSSTYQVRGFDRLMRIPDGIFQQHYRWLRPPYWAPDSFAERQNFWLEEIPMTRTTARIFGPSRIETAVEVSRNAFPDGAEEVFLARADVFPDAVAATPLTRRGPLLLVDPAGPLHPAVASEIRRLNPRRVTAVGGPGAVSDAVLQAAGRA